MTFTQAKLKESSGANDRGGGWNTQPPHHILESPVPASE